MTDAIAPIPGQEAAPAAADGAALAPAAATAFRALLAREDGLLRVIDEATRALRVVLDDGVSAGPDGLRTAARAALAALAALTQGRDGPAAGATGAAALAALHADAQARGDEGLAREAEALLRARGLEAFPRDAQQAASELAAGLDGYEVVRVSSDDVQRDEVVRVAARGLRASSGQSDVAARARLEVSRGPRDPLEGALEDLEDVLGRTPVPVGAPALGVGALREALLRGDELDLATLAGALASADALEDEVVDLTLKDVYRLLGAIGVDVVPAPDARVLPPTCAREALDVIDHAAPPGAIARVRHRGFVRRASSGRSAEVLLTPSVVLSRGPRPALLGVLDRLARADGPPLGTLAALAADLVARVDAARDAQARGGPSAGAVAVREGLVAAALDLARALERLGDALGPSRADLDLFVSGEVLPALAALDPDVEVLPAPGARTLDDVALFEVEEVFDQTAPRGAVLAVRRVGLVDRRGGVRRVHPARVVVSRGAKSPLEHALDRIAALWPGPRPPRASGRFVEPTTAPERVLELCQDLRAVARRVDDAQALGTTADALPVARAAAALLDAIEPRALAQDATAAELTGVLDGALREALARLGVEAVTDGAGLSARRAFSPRPAGEVLGVARRGLLVGAEVVRKGEALVSLGPRGPLLLAADELEALLARADAWLKDDLREQLTARIGLERAVEADLLGGRQALGAGAPRERALALLELLDRARGAGDEARAALDPIVDGPLSAAFEQEGLRLFPRGRGPLEPALLGREDAFAAFEARPSRQPRGQPLEVLAHGVVEARSETHEVRRQARVVLSLGFDAGFGAAVDEALAALRAAEDRTFVPRFESIVARLRDPRAPVPEGEAIEVLFEALRAAAAPPVRDALGHVLEAMGLEVFPRVGAPFEAPEGAPDGAPEGAEGEVERAFSDDAPAGQVLLVREPGLRRGAAVLRRPAVTVSRGRPSDLQRALGDAAELVRKAGAPPADPVVVALEEAIAQLDALPPAEASLRLVSLLAQVEERRPELAPEPGAGRVDAAWPLARALAGRGFRVLPEGAGGRWDDVVAQAGEGAFEPPRKVLCDDAQGTVVAVERRAVIGPSPGPDGVVRKGRVRVAAGPPTELSALAEGLRPGLAGALTGEPLAHALEELDELLERIVNAHAERGYLLALPLANLLQKHDLKDKLGIELKEFMRKQGIKELIAYPNYDANRLGVSKLEEVRVKSDRPRGKIVRVLRPGFERTSDGAVLQKVRAEVSR